MKGMTVLTLAHLTGECGDEDRVQEDPRTVSQWVDSGPHINRTDRVIGEIEFLTVWSALGRSSHSCAEQAFGG